jgi:hypothetical protein
MRDGEQPEPSGDWSLVGVEDDDGEVHEIHGSKVCPECGATFAGVDVPPAGICPDCRVDLKSSSTDYMREIRGIPGGDPPAVRS